MGGNRCGNFIMEKNLNIDLVSPIIPGNSAAGVILGASLNELDHLFAGAKKWNRDCQIQVAIEESTSCLEVTTSNPGVPGRIESDYYFARGAVRLSFDANGILVMIGLANGYCGLLFNEIKIDDPLVRVLPHADLSYDDVDELHHASINQQEIGLSIYAHEASLASSPDQKISRIFIHQDFL